ncbi:hypothetical protein Mgra_00002796 [Meloidogyne graminicola]|uniref:Transmembrane protein n=1 Tax=Meloidogyne graminicola TaxID=189291 RepID=A0A8S9ZY25_9BILA|nr:hypothetical protein Mgra_00002796 [Meloidogyne graminicola]
MLITINKIDILKSSLDKIINNFLFIIKLSLYFYKNSTSLKEFIYLFNIFFGHNNNIFKLKIMLINYKKYLILIILIIQFNIFLITSINVKDENNKELIIRKQRDMIIKEIKEENNDCIIRVTKVIEYPGKCVKINSGTTACQNDLFLDPLNKGC